MLRQLAMTGAVLLYWPYAALLAIVEFGESCTRAGEGLLPTLFVGGPIIVFATLLVWLSRPRVPLSAALRLSLVASLAVSALITLVQIWNVTIMGHHPCGAEYNYYVDFVEKWDRWIPVANFVLIGIAALTGLGPLQRKLHSP
ncbi:MAG: hypothetical protein R3358_05080 [Woeseiaceae bacterium]|nr:hypothetical protein [Woeseiaceae bacterium]